MKTFLIIWLGQFISLIGSSLTSFSLGIWVYQKTGSVLHLSLLSLLIFLPKIIFAPLNGVIVDRFNRRWLMIISDTGAGFSSLLIVLFLLLNNLQIWHIYIAIFISSTFSAFQIPAYTAFSTQLLQKNQFSRAISMIQLGESISQTIAPILGGILLTTIKIQGIIWLDFFSFIFSIFTLFLISIPVSNQNIGDDTQGKKTNIKEDIAEGLKYLKVRSGLIALLVFLAVTNFMICVVEILFTPLMLSFLSPQSMGIILSVGSVGMILSSLIISILGRLGNGINNIFRFMLILGMSFIVLGYSSSIPIVTFAIFLAFFSYSIIEIYIQLIFQNKVPLHIQGRIFAIKQGITFFFIPLAYLIAGILADWIENIINSHKFLLINIEKLIDADSAYGIRLLFMIMGIIIIIFNLIIYQYPCFRLVEQENSERIFEKGHK
ncbi:MAG: MFS transporter [Oscillatoriales cyanobacterium]|uniref:MFS transporter n=1 Tax=Microcoleus anatoxicus TaxID=2705319 RepID=UPI00297498A9|nr:MAG: MFS transporter [Oscillatoriales cyanobacterium]TAF46778.1 MAG: MFS transporter [Oscillatoriales cyanobacterium]TAF70786.1 MAG: MFS transporter [Oscillatoriales cyanobacterium]